MSLVVRKPFFAYAKTKTQISCAVTAKLISAYVFATWIVQTLYFLNPTFQASSQLLWLYSLVCIGHGRKPRRPVFSQRGSYIIAVPNMLVHQQIIIMTPQTAQHNPENCIHIMITCPCNVYPLHPTFI